MVLGLGGWLKQRLTGESPVTTAARHEPSLLEPDPPDPETTRHEGRGVDAATLVDAVRRLVRDHKGRVGGGIHLINLDVVKERLGERWPATAERLLARIEIILDRRLTPADLYIRIEGPSYLIVFGELDQEAAKLKCALIGHEIEKHVFGDDADVAEIAVRASVFRLDSAAMGRQEEIDLLGMIRALKAGSAETVPGERRRRGHPAPAPSAAPGPASRLSYVMLPIQQGVAAVPSSFVYRPIWHTRHDAIATYLCQPVWLKSGGIGSFGENYVEYQLASSGAADIATIGEIARTFPGLAAEGRRVLLSMPVHFETIARSATRKDFIGIAAGLSPAERRLLSFELTGIDETVPQTRLTEIVATVQPFCRGVSLRCSLDRRRFFGVRDARIYAVGVEMNTGRGVEAGLLPKMDDFAAAADGAGLRTYAHGLRTRSLTSAAIAAGFDYVDGNPVATLTDRPSHAYRYRLIDLYREKLAEMRTGSE